MSRQRLLGAVLCGSAALVSAAQAEPLPASGRTVAVSAPVAAPVLVADTAPSLQELHDLGDSLGASEGPRRAQTFGALQALDADALPAVSARLSELRSRGFDAAAALSAMSEFRRVQGVEAPDGPVDLARGVLPVLERQRARGTLLAAELIGYLRALEAQKSPAAAELIVGELFALDGKLFKYEAPRTRERLAVLLLPALLRHRTHPKPWVRRFAEESLLELHIDSPGRAVQQDDVALLAAILDAYGDTLTFDAMPVVVSFVTDERVAVREAARAAVRRFGKNAIWQLRERYVNATGREADPSWGHQRTLEELLRLHDAPKHQAFTALVDKALAALHAGNPKQADALLDQALRDQPHDPDLRRAAPVYIALAEARLNARDLAPALAACRRALRLWPDQPHGASLRARILYLEAELRLAQGVVDLKAYEQALALDPAFSLAESALDELSGARAERERSTRRAIGAVAALLLALAGILVLRRRASLNSPPPDPEALPSAPPTVAEAAGTEA